MGLLISSLFEKITGKNETKILMLGLDGAGKTTILFKLKFGEVVEATPTIGFNVETVEYKKVKFTVWDICGNTYGIKKLWYNYYYGAKAVIFVIDSSNKERMEEVVPIFESLVAESLLIEAPFLIFVNKQDIAKMSVMDVISILGLEKLKEREWLVQPTSALTGEGLYQGLEWLTKIQNRLK